MKDLGSPAVTLTYYPSAILHRILELSNSALVTGIVTTKRLQTILLLKTPMLSLYRDIYYQEPELFTSQSVVDRYVDDISYTLGVNRDALNVVGLLALYLFE